MEFFRRRLRLKTAERFYLFIYDAIRRILRRWHALEPWWRGWISSAAILKLCGNFQLQWHPIAWTMGQKYFLANWAAAWCDHDEQIVLYGICAVQWAAKQRQPKYPTAMALPACIRSLHRVYRQLFTRYFRCEKPLHRAKIHVLVEHLTSLGEFPWVFVQPDLLFGRLYIRQLCIRLLCIRQNY